MAVRGVKVTCTVAADMEDIWKFCNGLVRMVAHGLDGPAWLQRKEGHLEVLQWARENGCPWDEKERA